MACLLLIETFSFSFHNMPLLQSFCTWFSVRMGSVIVAVISLVQSVVFFILSLVTIQFQNEISAITRQMLNQYDFLFAKSSVIYFEYNIIHVMMIVLIFILIYVCSSLSLIHASYMLKRWEIWPFIIVDFIKLLFLTMMFVISMMVIRKNVLDFNVVIVCLTFGGFYLLFQYYLWLCPLSLLQCISNMKNSEFNKTKKVDINEIIFHNYQSEFRIKSTLANRTYFLHQYGHLPPLNF